MNAYDLTLLLEKTVAAESALEVADVLPLDQRKELYLSAKTAKKELQAALRASVPFELIADGNVADTVRTFDGLSTGGYKTILNYSGKNSTSGYRLSAIDEIRVLGEN